MSRPARFITGSTMRHVAVMTATGSVGLMSLFLVDVANLFYISLLGQAELAAAIGFAGTVQFFTTSVSIGLSIAATATVSRAVGAGEGARARRLAASAMLILVAVLALVAALSWMGRRGILVLLGAEGETLEIAAGFLAIVLPSLPFLGIGMVAGGFLRAVGDGRRAMYVTLVTGAVAAVLDPIFIFALGLGVDGAAIVSVLARLAAAAVGISAAVRVHDIVARIDPRAALGDAPGLLATALPVVATQLSTPFGNAFLTRVVSEFGDSAVAGWAVAGRVVPLAFAGVFALTGAVGPIFGQNLGAKLFTRIRRAYRDALVLVVVYVSAVWAILWLAGEHIVRGFGLAGAGAEVVITFTEIGAAIYFFTGALYVSNAAFNNLGRPHWSTGFNWGRDALATPLFAALVADSFGPGGVFVIGLMSSVVVGSLAAVTARRYIDRLAIAPGGERGYMAAQPAFASGRTAIAAQLGLEESPSALEEKEKPR